MPDFTAFPVPYTRIDEASEVTSLAGDEFILVITVDGVRKIERNNVGFPDVYSQSSEPSGSFPVGTIWINTSVTPRTLNVWDGSEFVNSGYVHPNHTGDVTSVGAGVTTIAANAVTNAKLAQVPDGTIKGNNSGATSDPIDLTVAQVKTLLGLGTAAYENTGIVDGDIPVIGTGDKLAAGVVPNLEDLNGTLSLAKGGTGGVDASSARTNLGLGTAALVDTGTTDGDVPLIQVSGKLSHDVIPNLSDLNGTLDIASGGTGATDVAGIRTAIGLGTAALLDTGIDSGDIPLLSTGGKLVADRVQNLEGLNGTLTIAKGGTGATTAGSARTALGLGTAALLNSGTTSGTLAVLGASGIFDAARVPTLPNLSGTLTIAKGGTGATSVADARTALGLGTAAVVSTGTAEGEVPLLSVAGKLVADRVQNLENLNGTLTVAKGGTGGTTAASARTNLGLAYFDQTFPVSIDDTDSPYSVANGVVLLVDSSSGNVTVTLPAPAFGYKIVVKKLSAANTVTVEQNSTELIDGASSSVLSSQWESATLISDGANWYIV